MIDWPAQCPTVLYTLCIPTRFLIDDYYFRGTLTQKLSHSQDHWYHKTQLAFIFPKTMVCRRSTYTCTLHGWIWLCGDWNLYYFACSTYEFLRICLTWVYRPTAPIFPVRKWPNVCMERRDEIYGVWQIRSSKQPIILSTDLTFKKPYE